MLEKLCLHYHEIRRKVILDNEQMNCRDCGGLNKECPRYDPASRLMKEFYRADFEGEKEE